MADAKPNSPTKQTQVRKADASKNEKTQVVNGKKIVVRTSKMGDVTVRDYR